MNIVLRRAKIIDPQSPYNGQQADVFIQNGTIVSLNRDPGFTVDRELNLDGSYVSPGWVDVFAHFCDPGFEHRETLETGSAAAAAGGYTDVLVVPNTAPFIHNKAGIEYLVQKSKNLPVSIRPIGAITKNGEGKELAEMYDMHAAGAVAFSDGWQTVQSAGLLVKALQYLKAIDAVIIQVPDDKSINANGLMHEGVVSTYLGLPGKPAIAEELMVSRDIELAKYTGTKIHFTGISTAKSVALIAAAKAEGVSVTSSVTPYHLFFCDEDLKEYDTNLKVNPPLRTKADREALQKGVADGTIDCIVSHHLPQNVDDKLVEFEYAKNGMTGLQTAFAAAHTVLQNLPVDRWVALLSTNARNIFGLPQITINENKPAVLTIFNTEEDWEFTKEANRSKSSNSGFMHKGLKGRAIGIINEEEVFLTQEL